MTVKETIACSLRDAGYDLITALEETERFLAEFRNSNQQEITFVVSVNGKCHRVFKISKD